MKDFNDFKKDWPKIKKQLVDASQQALDLVKKGEEKVVKLTKEGKLQMDLTSCGWKREHLYYQIGKEFVKAKFPKPHTEKLGKLIDELTEIEKEEKVLQKKMKTERK